MAAQLEFVKEALRKWDPIGVILGPGEDEGPQDEYDSYAPGVLELILDGASVETVARHLQHIRVKTIGCPPNWNRDLETARILISGDVFEGRRNA